MIMRIAEVKTELLRMPLPRPMQAASSTGKKGGPVDKVNVPIIFITTEDGTTGVGYQWPGGDL
jgi:L-alanine-DL-glutamate epimerase-like enolase superfamily enzyme